MVNLYNNSDVSITNNQDLYDCFNKFILSDERVVFNKLYSRIQFYEMTKHLLGDIVECGVFKGSGLSTWLKILEINEPHSIKKVIGFDFFDPNFVDSLDDKTEKDTMKQVFDRCQNLENSEVSLEGVTNKLLNAGFKTDKFQLVKGDVTKTSKSFLEDKPGLRISILYLDLDLDIPTYTALVNMWDKIVDGGVIVFDEYAYHNWSEANGVDRFVKENNLTIHSTKFKAPTAYIIKK
jgi:hypothetical protein